MFFTTAKKDYAAPECTVSVLGTRSVICASNELQFQKDPDYEWVRMYAPESVELYEE